MYSFFSVVKVYQHCVVMAHNTASSSDVCGLMSSVTTNNLFLVIMNG